MLIHIKPLTPAGAFFSLKIFVFVQMIVLYLGKQSQMTTENNDKIRDYKKLVAELYKKISAHRQSYTYYRWFNAWQRSVIPFAGNYQKPMSKSTFYRKLREKSFTIEELDILFNIEFRERIKS